MASEQGVDISKVAESGKSPQSFTLILVTDYVCTILESKTNSCIFLKLIHVCAPPSPDVSTRPETTCLLMQVFNNSLVLVFSSHKHF